MLSAPDSTAKRSSTAQRAKLAYIYVRQSTAMQVRQHQESTQLQYRLVDGVVALGWPRERIVVIDDDLAKSDGWDLIGIHGRFWSDPSTRPILAPFYSWERTGRPE